MKELPTKVCKEVLKVLVHLKGVPRTIKWIKEVVRVHLREIDLMIILKGILSEVVKVLIHLKEVIRINGKEVVHVHLREIALMIILKGILCEVVKVLIHLKTEKKQLTT